MAHFKRRRPRIAGSGNSRAASFPNGTPSWWNIIFHTRPRRRRERAVLGKLLRELCLPDDAVFYDVGRKPHNYYW